MERFPIFCYNGGHETPWCTIGSGFGNLDLVFSIKKLAIPNRIGHNAERKECSEISSSAERSGLQR